MIFSATNKSPINVRFVSLFIITFMTGWIIEHIGMMNYLYFSLYLIITVVKYRPTVPMSLTVAALLILMLLLRDRS